MVKKLRLYGKEKHLHTKEKTHTQLRGGGLVFVGYTLACETRFFDRNRRHRRKRKPRRAHRVPGSLRVAGSSRGVLVGRGARDVQRARNTHTKNRRPSK